MTKKPVIFLDRDGVVCKEKSYIRSVDALEIFPYAKASVKIMHDAGFLVIVITNQSGVAKGIIDERDLIIMHEYLKKETGVDEIYYCPHHPPKSGEADSLPYIVNCGCRKPKTGMISKALDNFDLDLRNSYFVGDRAGDILTGEKIGAVTVLLESGYGSKNLEAEVEPDFVFEDLQEFAEYIQGRR